MDENKKSKPLIKEIAEYAGVSIGTVSIVLNGRGDAMRISKATQRRVLDAAREMNYKPVGQARRPRGADDGKVVAIFWSVSFIDVDMGCFFSGIHSAMKEMGYDVEIRIQLYDMGTLQTYKNVMTPERYNGIIVCGASDADVAFLDSRDFSLPVVLIGRNSQKFHCVYSNYYEIGKNVAQLFRRRGHDRVGIVTLRNRVYGSSLRQLGFLDGCDAYRLHIKPEWIQEGENRDYDSGYTAAKDMLRGDERPTAIFVTAPGQVLGSIAACRDAGLRVPEDIEILAFGENSLFAHYTPSVSTARAPMEAIAGNALSLLMLVIDNGIDMPMSRLLLGEYNFRESCGGFPDEASGQ